MDFESFLTHPGRFWRGETRWDAPVAVIDLGRREPWPVQFDLPPCPVIGFGAGDASCANHVDAIIETPATLEGTLAQIAAKPHAAAALVQLLRFIPALPQSEALSAESFAYAMLQASAEHHDWLTSQQQSSPEATAPGHVYTERAGAVMTVTMNRPEGGNAIDTVMRDGLYEAFKLADIDPSIELVHLRAEGKIFSLGADLDEFGTTRDPATAFSIRAATLPARMASRIGSRMNVHIDGACVGAGLEIAAFAKRITASPRAWFQLPELGMGILPGAGGCVSITNRIGRQRAALLMLSGKRLSARHALDWGLIDAIMDDPA